MKTINELEKFLDSCFVEFDNWKFEIQYSIKDEENCDIFRVRIYNDFLKIESFVIISVFIDEYGKIYQKISLGENDYFSDLECFDDLLEHLFINLSSCN